jgi:hypothetical protein
MSILKNFRNPWEDDNWVLQTDVLDKGVLENNVLSNDVLYIDDNSAELDPYRSYYFNNEGVLIARITLKTRSRKVFILDKSLVTKLREERDAIKDTKKSKSFYINALIKSGKMIATFDKKSKLSSSIFSKIYTYILKNHDFDLSKLYNKKLSAFGTNRENYNDPETIYYANTVHINENTFKLSLDIGQTLYDFCHVGNIVNAIGAHEYTGHGINKWSGHNEEEKTHYKAFEYQMDNHESWNYTTMLFKSHVIYLYLDALFDERSLTDAWSIYDKLKKKYGKYKEFKSIWTYYNR